METSHTEQGGGWEWALAVWALHGSSHIPGQGMRVCQTALTKVPQGNSFCKKEPKRNVEVLFCSVSSHLPPFPLGLIIRLILISLLSSDRSVFLVLPQLYFLQS